jgi:hypothetical protein
MAKEYQTSTVTLADGRVITGIIKAQDKQTVTVQTPNELLTYPRGDIEDIQTAAISMMPIELVKPLSEGDVRALVAYLASPKQIPLPTTGLKAPDSKAQGAALGTQSQQNPERPNGP